jgi:hypothetical protein
VYKVWESGHSWAPYVSASLGPFYGRPEHHTTLT